ncbi:MAG: HAD family hydrolase [Candidatus Nitrosocaldus sp.]
MKVVSFDLDGTIFKKGLDDIFWNRLVPELIARGKNMSIDDAVAYALKEYDSIGPNDIRWYIPEYWFDRFGLTHTLLDNLLDTMEEYYTNGIYDDVYLLADIKRYRVIITTCNPPAMARRKLSIIIKKTNASIYRLFSSISYNTVKNSWFYSRICRELNVEAENVLHVGDDVIQDLEIPRSIGMQALLMDRECKRINSSHTLDHNVICSIRELMGLI